MSLLPTDNFILDKLISAHDGDVALLYIWLCRNGDFDADKAACDLCKTSREIDAAHEKLSRLGLFSTPPVKEIKHLEPEEKLPEYTAKDILQRTASNEGFNVIIDEAQRIFGRVLSTSDLKILFGIYDHLGFSPELLCLMLNYCAELFAAKYGSGRLPTMRSIEKEAYIWTNREILTLEQAEEYIANAAHRRSAADKVKEALNIRGRVLSSTESKYINSWLDMGFDADALAIAYDRTVTNTGGLKWSYMNKIVQSWHAKGIHSPQEIAEKDTRNPSASGRSNAGSEVDIGYLEAVYKKVKNTNK